MAAKLRVLAIAVATGRIGHVFFRAGTLTDWGLSKKASKSTANATEHAKSLIDDLNPDVVITEEVGKHSRKGSKTKELIAAVQRVAAKAKLLDITVRREQQHDNKYAEAATLADHFPDIRPWLPRRPRIWESEPRNMIYFGGAGTRHAGYRRSTTSHSLSKRDSGDAPTRSPA